MDQMSDRKPVFKVPLQKSQEYPQLEFSSLVILTEPSQASITKSKTILHNSIRDDTIFGGDGKINTLVEWEFDSKSF